jgi:hypothetical protein
MKMKDREVWWTVWYTDNVWSEKGQQKGRWVKDDTKLWSLDSARKAMMRAAARHKAARCVRREKGGLDRLGPIVPHWQAYTAWSEKTSVPVMPGDEERKEA